MDVLKILPQNISKINSVAKNSVTNEEEKVPLDRIYIFPEKPLSIIWNHHNSIYNKVQKMINFLDNTTYNHLNLENEIGLN